MELASHKYDWLVRDPLHRVDTLYKFCILKMLWFGIAVPCG